MITNTTDMYKAFLDGIKKSSTAIVTPEQFNRIINEWGQEEWLATNALSVEFDQKQIDDLEVLRVVTDGEFDYNNIVLNPIAPITAGSKFFELPKVNLSIRTVNSNGQFANQTLPKYLRQLSVSFKIDYGMANECGLSGISEWLNANILRTDNRSETKYNPYRKPKDSRLYYETIRGMIRLITGTSSTPYAMRYEYLRRPNDIFFDKTNTANNVNCELREAQQKEIVDIAVRAYLERVQDPRYRSFLNEETIRSSQK